MTKMTIGARLYLTNGILIGLTLAMGAVAVIQLHRLSSEFSLIQGTYAPMALEASKVNSDFLQARRHEKDFIARSDAKYLDKMDATMTHFDQRVGALHQKASSIGLATVDELVEKMQVNKNSYSAAFGRVSDLIDARGDKDSGVRGDLRKKAHELEELIGKTQDEEEKSQLMISYLTLRRHEKDFILRHDPKYVGKAKSLLPVFGGAVDIAIGQKADGYVKTLARLADNVASYEAEYPAMRQAAHAIEEAAGGIETIVAEALAAKRAKISKSQSATITFLIVCAAVVLLTGGLMAGFTVRSLTNRLKSAITVLDESAEGLVGVSFEIAGGSQNLASGASEQAASIEETASSLEEMSAQMTASTENVNETADHMKRAGDIIEGARSGMEEISDSMDEIIRTSEETQRIVKTIDEIAFQTNLLALNAAVEAARAGDAGKGFAVVAEEVRNLAGRAATAARETTQLLEESFQKINRGAGIVSTTRDKFGSVTESTTRVATLLNEVLNASQEQAEGINQMTTAASQMDQAVQQTAANAEIAAASAEEMNGQTEQLRSVVLDLVKFIQGASFCVEDGQAPQEIPVAREKDPVFDRDLPSETFDFSTLGADVVIPLGEEDHEFDMT